MINNQSEQIEKIVSKSINNTIRFHCGFRVKVAIEIYSYISISSSRFLLKFKTRKSNSWCAA